MANREKLQYYEAAADTVGLPQKLSTILSDMKKAGLTAETLAEHAQTLPAGAAKAKEEDLALLWASYDDLLAGRFVDGDSAEEEMLRRLPQSGVMRGAAVWVYGFDVWTRPFCRLLAAIAKEAASLTAALTMDTVDAPDARIFKAQQNSAALLLIELREAGLEGQIVRAAGELNADAVLQYLERGLFVPQKKTFEGVTEALTLLAAPNPFTEVMEVAAWLWREHDRGVAWSDMAVAVTEPVTYGSLLRMALRASGIPFYLAEKMPAMRHGLVRMLLAALRATGRGLAAGGHAGADEERLCAPDDGGSLSTGKLRAGKRHSRQEVGAAFYPWRGRGDHGAAAAALDGTAASPSSRTACGKGCTGLHDGSVRTFAGRERL